MNTNFFAIDESDSTTTFSLTGILVPLENYDIIRQRIHSFTMDLIPSKTINLRPPELHGIESRCFCKLVLTNFS